MISVIIPCFNAANFIEETIESIRLQEIEDLEIIIIDDGSTDNSSAIIKTIDDSRIIYKYQNNLGVSSARNYGLSISKGEYVIFFDADDKMSKGFLEERRKVLDNDYSIGFSCGPVVTFPKSSKTVFGIADDVICALLTYQPQFSSCPSNYLIRRSVLTANNIFFNEVLSSTADRFFLIELSLKAQGKLIEKFPLLYRINPNSMSNRITQKLILDNECYLHELINKGFIPRELKREFLFRIQYILGMGFLRTGLFSKGIYYAFASLSLNPLRFFSKLFK